MVGNHRRLCKDVPPREALPERFMPQPSPPRRMRQRRRRPPRGAAGNGWRCSDTALPACQSDSLGLAATYLAALILLYLATRPFAFAFAVGDGLRACET